MRNNFIVFREPGLLIWAAARRPACSGSSDDACKFKDGEDNNNQADQIDYVVHGILR